MLQCTQASTDQFHWISGTPPDLEGEGMEGIQVQLRHRMKPVPALVTISPDGLSYVPIHLVFEWKLMSGSVSAKFMDPIIGVSPGQVLAVYHKDKCLGSGVIKTTRTMDEAESDEDTI